MVNATKELVTTLAPELLSDNSTIFGSESDESSTNGTLFDCSSYALDGQQDTNATQYKGDA